MKETIELGMPADEVLQTPGYTKRDAVKFPEQIGEDELGFIVEWYYTGGTLTMKRYGDPLCYRVAEIDWHQNIGENGIVRLDRRLPKEDEQMMFRDMGFPNWREMAE